VLLVRTLVTGIVGGSVAALMPIATRDLLRGGAQTYGIMLGAFGLRAVTGAFNVSTLRSRFGAEAAICLCVVIMGIGVAIVAVSRSPILTGVVLLFASAGWTASVTLFNVGIQLAAPRWVAGRALAAYQAAIAGGIAIGSWIGGTAAGLVGVKGALLASGVALILSSLLGFWTRMPTVRGPNEQSQALPEDPEVPSDFAQRTDRGRNRISREP
jgi:predicted MFS family arabinose efflux permease